jgi:hypothetical protein
VIYYRKKLKALVSLSRKKYKSIAKLFFRLSSLNNKEVFHSSLPNSENWSVSQMGIKKVLQ